MWISVIYNNNPNIGVMALMSMLIILCEVFLKTHLEIISTIVII